jgi:DNA modification methylase
VEASFEERISLEHIKLSNTKSKERAYGFYWTRKDPSLIAQLIEMSTSKEAVVLDPFMGSGSTAIALMPLDDSRHFIGIELNESPVRSLRFSLGLDLDGIEKELQVYESAINALTELYSFQTSLGIIEVTRMIHDRVDKRLVPKVFHYTFQGVKYLADSRNDPTTYNELSEVYEQRVKNFAPREDMVLQKNTRIAISENMTVSDAFGPIGFEALSILRELLIKEDCSKVVLSAMIHQVRLTDSKSQSQFPYWHPKTNICEKSALVALRKEIRNATRILHAHALNSDLPFNQGSTSEWQQTPLKSFELLNGSATIVIRESIPKGSVDLVITDPPYFDQVAYSEYLKMWEHFTGYASNLDSEIVQSNREYSLKSRGQFLEELEMCFREIRAVTKDEGLALIFFKDSKPKNLHDFISVIGRSGFDYKGQFHIAKTSHTYKQNSTKETTVGGDAILIFRPRLTGAFIEPSSDVDLKVLDVEFISIMRDYLSKNGSSGMTEILDNEAIFRLYPTGYFGKISSMQHLVNVAKKHFNYDQQSRMWSLS